MEWALAIVALTLLAVAGGSRLLSGTPVTPAMVFVPPACSRARSCSTRSTSPPSVDVRTLAEATLALVLFSDAARVDLRELRQDLELPVRLLGVGLPLTIARRRGAGRLALRRPHRRPRRSCWRCCWRRRTPRSGRRWSPSPRVPERIRQGLNVESGLNDGICVPLLLIVLATAEAESHLRGAASALSMCRGDRLRHRRRGRRRRAGGRASSCAPGAAGSSRPRGCRSSRSPARPRLRGRDRARRLGVHRRVRRRHGVRPPRCGGDPRSVDARSTRSSGDCSTA